MHAGRPGTCAPPPPASGAGPTSIGLVASISSHNPTPRKYTHPYTVNRTMYPCGSITPSVVYPRRMRPVTWMPSTAPRLPTMFMVPDTMAEYRRPTSWQAAQLGPMFQSLKNPTSMTHPANTHRLSVNWPAVR